MSHMVMRVVAGSVSSSSATDAERAGLTGGKAIFDRVNLDKSQKFVIAFAPLLVLLSPETSIEIAARQ